MKRIGILGHVGQGNLGDEAIIAAVIQNLRRRHPDVNITGFTVNPADTQARHKISAFPLRRLEKNPLPGEREKAQGEHHQQWQQRSNLGEWAKARLKRVSILCALLKGVQLGCQALWEAFEEPSFLWHCYKNLKGNDLLVIAGSHQLNDYVGGPWAFPYTLFKWVLMAKAVGAKVAFVSVGASPIRSRLGRFFIRAALSRADYQSYRDESSKGIVEQLCVSGQQIVCPDLAYSLDIGDRLVPRSSLRSSLVVGINPVPFYDPEYWPGSNARIYESYVGTLSDFALWLLRRGYAVLFFATQVRLDPPVISDIRMRMKAKGGTEFEARIIDCSIHSIEDLITALSIADMIVATRFHGVVIPFLLHKPVLGIAYHQKTHEAMAQMGQSGFAVDILRLKLDSLQERFVLLESRRASIENEIEPRLAIFQQALAAQYDQVLGLLEPGAGRCFADMGRAESDLPVSTRL